MEGEMEELHTDKETEECPYCKVRVRRLRRHIELRHKEFTIERFLIESRITVILAVLLAASLMLLLASARIYVAGVELHVFLMAATIIIGGIPLAKEGLEELFRERAFDVDVLVVVASVGAVAIDYWTEAAVLIFLFTVAETLENYSVFSNRRTLRGLLDLSPTMARVERGGSIKEVRVEELSVGEVVEVRPGEGIPVDGEVVGGRSSVNQAPITGESMPVKKEVGDQVFAGTLNKEGFLRIVMTKKSGDFTLSRIVDLIEEEEGAKAETERFINRFAAYYTPLMLVLAGLVFAIPTLLGMDFREWLYRSLVLLVISCPCAFVISTPVTMFSTITNSARKGVIIKGGAYIEALRDTSIFVFDKTGTLTRGEPQVTDLLAFGDMDEQEVLAVAASLETNSTHPLAAPILSVCEERGCSLLEVAEFASMPGRGVRGRIGKDTYTLGSPETLALDPPIESEVDRLSKEGKTVVILGREGRPMGLIAITDTLREGAGEVIQEMRKRGIRTVMLTGDNEQAAARVAEMLGFDEYRASLLPEDKLREVGRLKERGKVAMVGDGVNDAPALVRSDIGIAMGAAGSDTALESSDMALMEDDLTKLIYLLDLSHRTMRVVRVNIYSSIAVKAALAALTFVGLVTLWMAVGIGDMGMSLLVTLNAILLARS